MKNDQRNERNSVSFESNKSNYLDSFYQSNLSPAFLTLAQAAREESRKLNKERISVSLNEAYIISELVKQVGCLSYIELGSLTGYSALFILRALKPSGTLYCFEKDEHCANFIEALFKDLSSVPELVGKKLVVMRGDAQETLENWTPPVDVQGAFIDANKGAYVEYLNWIEARLKGSYLIIADNVFLRGSVWGEDVSAFSEKQIKVMNEFNRRLATSPKYSSYFVGTSEGLLVAKRNS